MKLIKKLAAAALAAALALTMMAGCGSKSTEATVLDNINAARAAAQSGLEPLSNDAQLSQAAAALLEAYAAKESQNTYWGKGYCLSSSEVQQALGSVAQGKTIYTSGTYPDADTTNGYYNGYYPGWSGYYAYNGIYVAPTIVNGTSGTYYESPSSTGPFWLIRRANADGTNKNCVNGSYGYMIAMRENVKVGIAARTINGENFVMVLYSVG